MAKPIDPEKIWYVVRTNIQCEGKASDNIRLAGFDVYFPRQRIEKKHRRNNTYLVKERPLMVGYIFVGMPKNDKLRHFGFVRACEGVEKFIEYQGKPIPVSGHEVQALYLAEVDMRFDDTRAARIHRKEEAKTIKATLEMKYARGKRFDITDGPFANFQAIVEEVTKSGNIKAMVSLFGRLTTVEFEAAQLSAA
jgi:transcription termination/antitermination protein NusG